MCEPVGGVRRVGEVPVEDPVLLELIDELPAGVDRLTVELDGHVLVDHGHRDLVQPAVRIPARPQVQRAVHQRNEHHEAQRQLRQGALEPAQLVRRETEGRDHRCPPSLPASCLPDRSWPAPARARSRRAAAGSPRWPRAAAAAVAWWSPPRPGLRRRARPAGPAPAPGWRCRAGRRDRRRRSVPRAAARQRDGQQGAPLGGQVLDQALPVEPQIEECCCLDDGGVAGGGGDALDERPLGDGFTDGQPRLRLDDAGDPGDGGDAPDLCAVGGRRRPPAGRTLRRIGR